MSDYIVTARKYRPMRFDDVEAQRHVTQTLKNAVKQDRLAHAYLFAGPRGVGKTSTARLLAKLVNCQHPTADFEPDNTCETCTDITEGRSFDVQEIDGASNNSVEDVRNLREAVRYAPAKGKYKVYIIDEVHMLSASAFNALLKTLEEPPKHVLFIFATTEVHKLPATILSRCQRFDFRRIAIEEIMANLRGIAGKEGLEIDDESLLLIAKKGDGSMRDAQSIFDQIVALCGKSITKNQILQALNIVDQDFYFRVTDLIKAKDAKGGLELVRDIMDRGYDIKEFLGGLTEHFRNILTAATTHSTAFIEESDFYKTKYAEVAAQFSVPDILRLLKLINGTEAAIRWSAQPRFKLETDIVQMITMSNAAEVGEVLQKIEALSKELQSEKKKLPPDSPANSVGSGEQAWHSPPGTVRPSVNVVSGSSSGNSGAGYRPRFTRPSFAGTASSAPPASPASPGSFSEGEVASRWQEFVAEVRRERIAVGTALESATFAGVMGNAIRINASDFTASVVNRNKEMLGAVIERVFKARGRIEVEIGSTNDAGEKADGPGAPRSSSDEHPVVQALMRELGAEPLDF